MPEENESAHPGGKPQPTKEQLDAERKKRGEYVTPHQEGDGFGPGSTGGEGGNSAGENGPGSS